MLKKGDIILIIFLLAAILLGYAGINAIDGGGEQTHRIAVIKQNNEIIRTIDLDRVKQPETIEISGQYSEVILVEAGRIRFLEADCPDQVCVETGWLTKKGQMAVCLPNRTIIKIEGKDSNVDGVTY